MTPEKVAISLPCQKYCFENKIFTTKCSSNSDCNNGGFCSIKPNCAIKYKLDAIGKKRMRKANIKDGIGVYPIIHNYYGTTSVTHHNSKTKGLNVPVVDKNEIGSASRLLTLFQKHGRAFSIDPSSVAYSI